MRSASPGRRSPGRCRLRVAGLAGARWRPRQGAWSVVWALLLAAGAALRAWQYLAAAAQNVDELAVSRNVTGLSWAALAGGPLAFEQAAPKGFLLLAKAAAAMAGPSDLALRSVAFASSLLSLALMSRLARRLLAEPAAVALALAWFALRPELIYAAAEVKPYAVDLAAGLALTLLAVGWSGASGAAPAGAAAAGPGLIRTVAGGPGADAGPGPLGPGRPGASGPGYLSWRRALLLGGAGAAAVCFSHGAVLMLAGLAAALLIRAWHGGREAGPTAADGGAATAAPAGATTAAPGAAAATAPGAAAAATAATAPAVTDPPLATTAGIVAAGRWRSAGPGAALAAIWAAAGAGAVVWAHATMTPACRAYLQRFWSASFGPGVAAGAGAHARWLAAVLTPEMPAAGLGPPWPAVYGALALLGALLLWRRHGNRSLLLSGPAVATLAAAEAHLYPFASRLVLFLVPGLLLAAAAGLEALAALWRWAVSAARGAAAGASPAAAALGAAALGAAAIAAAAAAPAAVELARQPPIYRTEEMKPILRQVARLRRPGDAIYVYYGAGQAVRFYGARQGLRPAEYEVGSCLRGQPRGYLRELDRYRGRARVWVLISHALPWLGEDAAILSYLDALGARRLALRAWPQPRGFGFVAEAFLYDLQGARRLERDAAERFPLPAAAATPNPRIGCVGPQDSSSPMPPLPPDL
jgi:hypothetical protein